MRSVFIKFVDGSSANVRCDSHNMPEGKDTIEFLGVSSWREDGLSISNCDRDAIVPLRGVKYITTGEGA